MRILFTFIGGIGHFRPLVAVARAVQRAGHTVAVAGSGKVTPGGRGGGLRGVADERAAGG